MAVWDRAFRAFRLHRSTRLLRVHAGRRRGEHSHRLVLDHAVSWGHAAGHVLHALTLLLIARLPAGSGRRRYVPAGMHLLHMCRALVQGAHLLSVLCGSLRSVWHGSGSDEDGTLCDAHDEFVHYSSLHPVADRPSWSRSWDSSGELRGRGPSSGCSYSPLEVLRTAFAWDCASYRSVACVASEARQAVAGTSASLVAAVVVAAVVAAAAAVAAAAVGVAVAAPVPRQAIDVLACDPAVKTRSSAIVRAEKRYTSQKMPNRKSMCARRSPPARAMCCFSSRLVAADSAPVAVGAMAALVVVHWAASAASEGPPGAAMG